MEKFVERKEEMAKRLKEMQIEVEEGEESADMYLETVDEFTLEFNSSMQSVWKELMKMEVILFEQMDEVNQIFEQQMTEMVNFFIEQSQGHFTEIRGLEQNYTEAVTQIANRFLSNLQEHPESYVPPELELVRNSFPFLEVSYLMVIARSEIYVADHDR